MPCGLFLVSVVLKLVERQVVAALESPERIVADKTEALRTSNRQLNNEVKKHKETVRELRKTKELAEKANRSKSEFLANMSHD